MTTKEHIKKSMHLLFAALVLLSISFGLTDPFQNQSAENRTSMPPVAINTTLVTSSFLVHNASLLNISSQVNSSSASQNTPLIYLAKSTYKIDELVTISLSLADISLENPKLLIRIPNHDFYYETVPEKILFRPQIEGRYLIELYNGTQKIAHNSFSAWNNRSVDVLAATSAKDDANTMVNDTIETKKINEPSLVESSQSLNASPANVQEENQENVSGSPQNSGNNTKYITNRAFSEQNNESISYFIGLYREQPSLVGLNKTIEIGIALVNNGLNQSNITIKETLPSNWTFIQGPDNTRKENNTLIFTIPHLNAYALSFIRYNLSSPGFETRDTFSTELVIGGTNTTYTKNISSSIEVNASIGSFAIDLDLYARDEGITRDLIKDIEYDAIFTIKNSGISVTNFTTYFRWYYNHSRYHLHPQDKNCRRLKNGSQHYLECFWNAFFEDESKLVTARITSNKIGIDFSKVIVTYDPPQIKEENIVARIFSFMKKLFSRIVSFFKKGEITGQATRIIADKTTRKERIKNTSRTKQKDLPVIRQEIKNGPPNAVLQDLPDHVRGKIILDASQSYDPDNDELSYSFLLDDNPQFASAETLCTSGENMCEWDTAKTGCAICFVQVAVTDGLYTSYSDKKGTQVDNDPPEILSFTPTPNAVIHASPLLLTCSAKDKNKLSYDLSAYYGGAWSPVCSKEQCRLDVSGLNKQTIKTKCIAKDLFFESSITNANIKIDLPRNKGHRHLLPPATEKDQQTEQKGPEKIWYTTAQMLLIRTVEGERQEIEIKNSKDERLRGNLTIISEKKNKKVDAEIDFSELHVKKIKFFDLDLQKLDLKLEDVAKEKFTIRGKTTLKSFAFDPAAMNFTSGIMTITAAGNELYKCRDYNFSLQTCYGSWNKVMDLVPGQEYSINISAEDPGFAETGLVSINTNKSIYHPGESAKITIILLNTEGKYVSGANLSLTITDPLNMSYDFSTDTNSISLFKTGIYELEFNDTNYTGNYSISARATGSNLNATFSTYFEIRTYYDFDIVRSTPHVIDPWQGPFYSSIILRSYNFTGVFNFTEILPKNFSISDSGGAATTVLENYQTLEWSNLTNNSVVSYRANAPLISPALAVIGPGKVAYNGNTFREARPWYMAIDAVCTQEYNFSANAHGPTGTITSFRCKNCGGTQTSADTTFTTEDTATAANMYDAGYTTDGQNNKLKLKDKGTNDFNVLKFDTGINTSWNIPGDILLRVVGTDDDSTKCKGKQTFTHFENFYIYFYDTATTVNTTTFLSLTNAQAFYQEPGACTSDANTCSVDSINLSIKTLFNAAPAGSNLVLRLFADDTGNNADLTMIPEIYLQYEVITDTAPPAVIRVNATPKSQTSTLSVNISANVTDENTISGVLASVLFPNGSAQNYSLADPDLDSVYAAAFTDTLQPGAYTVTIFANDTFNNMNNTEKTNFTILSPSLSTDNTSYIVLKTVNISGNYWRPSSTVTLNITNPSGNNVSGYPKNISADSNGTINDTYIISLSSPGGAYTIFAYDASDTGFNATTTFNLTALVLSTDTTQYIRAETVYITGNGFEPNANVTVRINDPTGDPVTGFPRDVIANSTGGINDTWLIPVAQQLGIYTVNATDAANTNRSTTNTFEIVTAIIESDKASYAQGTLINITGYNWDNSVDVTINITDPDNQTVYGPHNITSNATGFINDTFFINYNATLGNYTISGIEPSNPEKTDTFLFLVTQRTVTLSTDYSWYKPAETVQISGSGFSPDANVTIAIYNSTGQSVAGYPHDVTANATGSMNDTWHIPALQMPDNYTINATDANFTNLNGFIIIEINNQSVTTDKPSYNSGETVYITGSFWDRYSNVSINITNATSYVVYHTTVNATEDGAISDSWLPPAPSLGSDDYNLTAYQTFNLSRNATTLFSVLRTATLYTDKAYYDQYEIVNITGNYYTANADVMLTVISLANNGTGFGFPVTVTADSSGDINYPWNDSDICSGVYNVQSEDQTYPAQLFANTNFTIYHFGDWNQTGYYVHGSPASVQSQGNRLRLYNYTYVNSDTGGALKRDYSWKTGKTGYETPPNDLVWHIIQEKNTGLPSDFYAESSSLAIKIKDTVYATINCRDTQGNIQTKWTMYEFDPAANTTLFLANQTFTCGGGQAQVESNAIINETLIEPNHRILFRVEARRTNMNNVDFKMTLDEYKLGNNVNWQPYTGADFSLTDYKSATGFSYNKSVEIQKPCTEFDVIPPQVTNVSASPNPQIIGLYANLSANVSDGNNLSLVIAQITYPNGSVANFTMTDAENDDVFNYLFSVSLPGTYNLTILANDSMNNINNTESMLFNFTYDTLQALTDNVNYVRGDTVYVRGTGFEVNSTVTINIFNPTLDPVTGYPKNVTSNATGGINDSWTIPGLQALGTYTVNATDQSNQNRSAATSFEIVTAIVESDLSSYPQGTLINITGYNWDNSVDVTINITDPNNQTVYGPHNITSNATGFINDTFFINYNATLGNYTISGIEPSNPEKTDTFLFLVTQRTVTVATNYPWYKPDETVQITGSGFSPDTNVTIAIYNSTGQYVAGYPHDVIANATGSLNDTWLIPTLQMPDNYTINATDVNFTNLFNYTIIEINNAYVVVDQQEYSSGDTVTITGYFWDRNANITLNIYNSSGQSASGFPKNVSSSNNGVISDIWTAEVQGFSTNWTLDAYDPNKPAIDNSSANFTVFRVATLQTNRNFYDQYQLVNITGSYYSSNNNVTLNIISLNNNGHAKDYPKKVISNAIGDINDIWNTTNFCQGTYLVESVDEQFSSQLHANASFNIYKFGTGVENGYYAHGGTVSVGPAGSRILHYNYSFVNSDTGGASKRDYNWRTGKGGNEAPPNDLLWHTLKDKNSGALSEFFSTVLSQPSIMRGTVYTTVNCQDNNGNAEFRWWLLDYDPNANSTTNISSPLLFTCGGGGQVESSTSLAAEYYLNSGHRIVYRLEARRTDLNNVDIKVKVDETKAGNNVVWQPHAGADYSLTDYKSALGVAYNLSTPTTATCIDFDILTPSITIHAPVNYYNTTDSTPEINFSIIDDLATVLNYSIYIDGSFNGQNSTVNNNTPNLLNISTLAEGQHNVTIEGMDDYANADNASILITIDYSGPNTTLTSPHNFTNISTNTKTLRASASDPYTEVDTVTFLYRQNDTASWSFACDDNTGPYQCSWNLTLLPDSDSYQIRVYANDSLGNIGGNDTVYNITVDRTGPDTSITTPTNFTNITTNTKTLRASASDLYAEVDTVTFLYRQNATASWAFACDDGSSPYQCTWNLTMLPDGSSYQIRGYANDSRGNTGANDTVYNITIDRTGPGITDSNAAPNPQKLGLGVNITANVSDLSGVSYVEARIVMPNSSLINLTMHDENGDAVYNASFFETYLTGVYTVTIYANDSLANAITSSSINFTIQYDNLSLVTDNTKYVRGDTVYITGTGFNALSNVTLTIYNTTGQAVSGFPSDVISNSTGGINITWLIPASEDLGNHSVNATDANNTNRSITQDFEVLSAILNTDQASYEQGAIVLITGSNWDNTADVTLNISDPDSNEVFGPVNVTSNSSGNINASWTIPFNETTGTHTIHGVEPGNPLKESSQTFLVTPRTVVVQTDRPWYKEFEQVNITGFGFSYNSTVTLDIYNASSISIPGYPKNVSSNATGGINDTFTVSSLGEGTYTVNATDLNYTNLQANANFEIASAEISTARPNYENGETVNIIGRYWDRNVFVTLDLINETGQSVSGYPLNVSSNSTGGFVHQWTAEAIGTGSTMYNISSYEPDDLSENASNNFTVVRKVTLQTDKQEYDQNETVNITGGFYTSNGDVIINIIETATGQHALSFPKTLSADPQGNIENTDFTTSMYCEGVYNVTSQDLTYPILTANTLFNITFLEENYSLETADNDNISLVLGPEPIMSGSYLDTQANGGSVFYVGHEDPLAGGYNETDVFLELQFNISHINTSYDRIQSINIFLDYCYSGSANACDGADPPDEAGYYTEYVQVFNHSNSQWADIGTITVGSTNNEQNQEWNLSSGFADYVNSSGFIRMRWENHANYTGSFDDNYFIVDYARLNVTYNYGVYRDCEPFDVIDPVINGANASPSPAALLKPITITANVTDNSGVDAVIAILIAPNGSQVNFTLFNASQITIYNGTFNSTTQIGIYNVSIWANDTWGNSNYSFMASFNITYYNLSLQADDTKYVAGETVFIAGNGFSPSDNVTINIYNSTGQSVSGYPNDSISNASGAINDTWLIPVGQALGTYTINATDLTNPSRSMETTFEVVTAIIETVQQFIEQAGTVNITGEFWGNYVDVTLNITDPNGIVVYGPLNVTSNGSGFVNTYWTSDYNASLGNYTLSAMQPSNPNKFDNHVFNITQRPVSVAANFPWYKDGDTVWITGFGFSPSVKVTIAIYNETGQSIAGYPKNVSSNSTGAINDSFVISGLGESNYTINASDTKYPNLINSTLFEIALATISTDKTSYINGETINITGEFWTKNTNITIDIKNETGQSITGYPKNITSDDNGIISDALTATAAGLGISTYNITAINPGLLEENASSNYTVQRVALLSLDKSEYDQDELVLATGQYFSSSGQVKLLIRYLNNSGFASYYPKLMQTNAEGNFTHNYSTSGLCQGAYFIEATDQAVSSLYANASFNITFLDANTSLEKALNSSPSGTYNVYGGNAANTTTSDNDWQYIGGADYAAPFQAFINYTFDLTALHPDPQRINNLSFSLEYCHSGAQYNPQCGQGFPHEGEQNGTQIIDIYNASNGQWHSFSSLPVNNISDDENTITFYIDAGLADFVQNNLTRIRIEVDFNQSDFQDDILLIDYLAMNMSYDAYAQRPCTELTSKFLEIRNIDQSNSLIENTQVEVYNVSDMLIDAGNGSYFRYLPFNDLNVLVFTPFSGENLTYEIFDLNFSTSVNITSQVIENYLYGLPNLITGVTPLIAVNDSAIAFNKTQLTIPKRGLAINTILHCTNYLYANGECLSFELNETDDFAYNESNEFIIFNVTSFDAFGGGPGDTLPNITEIRIYNATNLADSHQGGQLLDAGLNKTFNLTSQETYRMEFIIKNDGRKWNIAAEDIAKHMGLNASWQIDAANDIWYVDGANATNYTGGTFASGTVGWNLSLGGRYKSGETGAFYYVVNITTNNTEWYPVSFLVNDTSKASGSKDNSTYKIIDTIPPAILLNSPLMEDNLSVGSIVFNWTAVDNSNLNLTCSLLINSQVNKTGLNVENNVSAATIVLMGDSAIYNWSVNCSDYDKNTNISEERNFTAIAGPFAISIFIGPDNQSIDLNWSAAMYADSYNIHYSLNYSQGFSSIPNVTGISDLNWTDNNGFASAKRYYKVAAVKGNAAALSDSTAGKHTEQLYAYWNLMSVPFNQSNWVLYNGTNQGRDLFTQPAGCLVSLWGYNASNQSFERTDYDGAAWLAATGSENFIALEAGRGYWFETNANCNITFVGTVPSQNLSVALQQYWNIAGWYSARYPELYNETREKPIAISPENSIATIVRYNAQSNTFEPTFHINYGIYGWWWIPAYSNQDFTVLDPFKGYYFDAAQNADWTINPNLGT